MNYQQSTVRVLEEIEAELYDEAIVQQYLDAVGEQTFSDHFQGIYMAGIEAQRLGRRVTDKQHNAIRATHAKITKWLAKQPRSAQLTSTANNSEATQLDRIEALLTDIRDALRTGLGGAQ